MINEQVLQGHWNEVKGKLRNKWGQLTNDDIASFNGDVDRLIGVIQRKTGEGREAIESFLDEMTAEGSTFVEQAADNLRQYSQQAGERLQKVSDQAADALQEGYDSVRNGYQEAEAMVRRRPSEAVAVCFGAGVLTGLLVALLLHKR